MTQHRDTILMAASQEFIHQGYAATSLASIAARIGLTKGALARPFPSKEQLAWGIIDAVHTLLEEGRARIQDAHPSSGIRPLLEYLAALNSEQHCDPRVTAALALLIDRSSPTYGVTTLADDLTHALEGFLSTAQRCGELPPDTRPRELAQLIFVTFMGQTAVGDPTQTPSERRRFIGATPRTLGATDVDAILAHLDRAAPHPPDHHPLPIPSHETSKGLRQGVACEPVSVRTNYAGPAFPRPGLLPISRADAVPRPCRRTVPGTRRSSAHC